MTSTPKSAKHVPENESSSPSPLAGQGPGGHKPSFKGTKLARRARSFKDDFLGKFSQMRGPNSAAAAAATAAGSPAGRAHSPKGSGHHGKPHDEHDASVTTITYAPNKSPIKEMDDLWKQIQVALKHFREIISKNKLEMLPGNGTIVLDTVWMINLWVKSNVSGENSSSVISATNRMYQSVARLIKLCDDVLIDDKSAELNKDNVEEILDQVDEAVKNLADLAREKITQQQQALQNNSGGGGGGGGVYKTAPRTSYGNASLEMPAQRNSLPDIPLSPREREILEQTCCKPSVVRSSHSTESILRDPSPPPKPPLPDSNSIRPPPLPPKKKNLKAQVMDDCFCIESPITSSLERMSLRSKSPESSNSLLSESAGSIESMFNHSREEDELMAIKDGDMDMSFDHHNSDIIGANGSHNSWEESSLSSSLSNNNSDHITSVNDYHRLSNTDSGIVSFRSSSYSKRSSQQSSISSQFGSGGHHITSKHSANVSEMVKSESTLQNLYLGDNQLSVGSFSHKTSNSSSVTVSNESVFNRDEMDLGGDETPPAIPQKTRKKHERQPSPYDNVPDDRLGGEVLISCQMHQSHQSLSSSTSISSTTIGQQDSTKPPPLPPKKKHMFQSVAYSVMAYMEMFGNCSHTNDQEFMRHSIHVHQSQYAPSHLSQSSLGSVGGLPTTQSCSFSHTSSSSRTTSQTQIHSLNLHTAAHTLDQRIPSPLHSPGSALSSSSTSSNSLPPALPPKQRTRKSSSKSPPPTPTSVHHHSHHHSAPEPRAPSVASAPSPAKTLPDLLEHTAAVTKSQTMTPVATSAVEEKEKEEGPCDIDLMEELDADKYLVKKKEDEEGPEIRGGPIDALIIQATKATKNGVFTYQEAFLTTYRTFISPLDLISKLIRRYNHFYSQPDKKPRSREAFALIVRVVSDLTASDLDEQLQQKLMSFVQQLISCGELTLAKALRVKHLERHEAKLLSIKLTNTVTSLSLSAKNFSLLDFKSEQIAEQMTLLDSELFNKIEIPEVLTWAQEQNEERSPNLTRFSEHFNKMSYWARTRILTAETKDIREKFFLKFIKIMKHLRKINNYNSYLAMLSALDSAPVRRLEWQKHVQEGLKEYCALIDSSSSFRAYRLALENTEPPCIPYIGLVLQDLTFVHIGNSNLLPDGMINFSKRWQQYHIVENMKRFKKEKTYAFKKNEKIIQFFGNFDDLIGEDAMWQLSETIKPRGGKKTNQ
ncbi:guanine nucleotide-releasing factor 2 isoform X3 [Aethina tumida]|uniref:guanine nucleotide-releasing factor 2 isoform X3 n=1 Tax=Aethina tumida TaxID=116153 RepID=UPI0021474541|nr:guanine nucleotide-releasing factor 2 isoform X3 [Aethina tumida]